MLSQKYVKEIIAEALMSDYRAMYHYMTTQPDNLQKIAILQSRITLIKNLTINIKLLGDIDHNDNHAKYACFFHAADKRGAESRP